MKEQEKKNEETKNEKAMAPEPIVTEPDPDEEGDSQGGVASKFWGTLIPVSCPSN